MIKIIFSDMDGTLLDENGQLPEEFPQVMEELKAYGVLFAPASGRQYYSLLDSFAEYKDEFIFLAENGTLVKQHDKELFSSPMPKKLGLKVLAEGLATTGAYTVLCGKKQAYILKNQSQPEFLEELHKYFTHTEAVDDFAQVDDDIIKVSFFDPKAEADRTIYPHLKKYNGRLQVVLASAYWVDIIGFGINKGIAIQQVQKKLKITPKECAAFGDYMNDAEMMSSVYYSYAMANAHPKVKELARFEARSNAEHGVMVAIRELIASGKCGEKKN